MGGILGSILGFPTVYASVNWDQVSVGVIKETGVGADKL